ncbi:MAG: glycosyltransferase [Chloroflexi bacterium]|nr:glycosyltransferase [Chloroflexota bacterium]
MAERGSVSVIFTLRDEAASIGPLLESLLAQERRPEEIVIVDGGSRDGTPQIVQAYHDRLPIVLLRREGCNIAQGRNAAIAAARGAVIASTDAGVRLDAGWLKHIVGPLEADPSLEVVSGFFLSDPRSPFELALGATALPELRDIDPQAFNPSSRSVAFRRQAWERAGGYPEWLDYCEDLVFDFALRRSGARFAFAPRAIAYHRPRSNLRDFVIQYFRYARGDGKADLWRARHAIRYATYLILGPALLVLGATSHILWWGLLFLGGIIYLWVPYRRLGGRWGGASPAEKLEAIVWVPIIRVVGDITKMLGYPVGTLWRWRHPSLRAQGPSPRD